MAYLEIIRPAQLTRWQRFAQSLRSFTLGPYNIKDKELARHFGGRSAASGVVVDEEGSLSFAAVWNAVLLIAQDVAKVPLPLYRRSTGGGKDQYREHHLYELIHDEPNEEMSSFVFRRTLQGHVLVWGNGYAEIERDLSNRPVALWPLMPWAVTPFREGHALKYRVKQPASGNDIVFDRRDILHLSGLGLDGVSGFPPIRKAFESIGLGLATERFGAAFFGNGSTFGGIISYPVGTTTNPQVREENRREIATRHQGLDRSHRLLTLYEGAKFEQMGVPPNAAQFLETRRFQIEEVARWFNIPVHKLKELARSTNNNIEHQGIEYATDTLQPWFRMWEGELRLKLIPRLERKQQFFEHITEALTRGDSAAQGELISKQFSVGGMTPNEIRAKFNNNPVAGGDSVWVPTQMMPLDLALRYWDASIEEMKAKAEAARRPPEPPPVAPKEDEESAQKVRELTEQLEHARHATQAAIDATDVAKAERDEARVALDRATSDLAKANEDKAALAAEARREHDLFRSAEEGEQAALSQRDAVQLERDALLTARQNDRLTHESQLTKAQADRDTALRLQAEAIAERDAATTHAADAQRTGAEQEQRAIRAEDCLTTLRAELVEAITRTQTLGLAMEEASRQRDIALAEKGVMAERVPALESELATMRKALEQSQQQRAAVLAGMRSLFVDTTERILQREVDRARKHQATPAKLKAWVDGFYPLHVDTCRRAFLPLVGPWATLTGTDPDALLERLVTQHVEVSRAALLQVADSDDADQMAAGLERTLRRWETERAATVADALMREGMAAHG
jgi:HK97 family phage portal protein